nr:immunoglobulin heavy chain junction region [Mus musculus]MBK4188848.1 immunoglobulin heavy chain junction region [Mus musculus]
CARVGSSYDYAMDYW